MNAELTGGEIWSGDQGLGSEATWEGLRAVGKKITKLERKKREENGEEQDESDSSTWQAGQNWEQEWRVEDGDNQSHHYTPRSTNANICDLENKPNFSEAAFPKSYLWHFV